MKPLALMLGVLILVSVGGLLIVFTGLYDVAATRTHGDVANWIFSTTMRRSVARRAADVEVPDLDDRDLQLAGLNDYREMCANCHTLPGQPASAVARGLNPPPPDLAVSAQNLSSAELFWITKHGIRMTGMPAWGPTHTDGDLWRVVAFVETLPDLDAPAYEALSAQAEGMGGHHDEPDQPEDTEVGDIEREGAGEHDHSSHTH